MQLAQLVSLVLLSAALTAYGSYVSAPVALPTAPYADWAHSHWVWLGASQASQSAAADLVKGYLDRGIRVGGYDIDSGWATGYTTYEWNTEKYPDAQGFINLMHAQGIRVILWATSTINTDTALFNYTADKGYLLKHPVTRKPLVLHYWHGDAGYIDYTNPDAVAFYHSLMDNQLKQGYDGWKNDGTDPFLLEAELLEGGILSHAGIISERQYASMYYSDFFFYSRQVNGNVTLCMNRPFDSYKNYVYFKFAPRDVVFSGWVGDEDPTFAGLRDALKNMLYSAANNYVSFGCDIGGYRNGDGHRPREVLLRWAQLGAFVGLMENGGDGEHRPWAFDTQNNSTTDIYRTFVDVHYEIAPYLLTLGAEAFEAGTSIMHPFTEQFVDVRRFDYTLGSDLYVSPIVENVTDWLVDFPKTTFNSSKSGPESWVWWFDSTQVFVGGTKHNLSFPMDVYPVYKRAGSVLPVHFYASRLSATAVWSNSETPVLGVDVVWPQALQEGASVVRDIRAHAAATVDRGMRVVVTRTRSDGLAVDVSASPRPFIVRVSGVHPSSAAQLTATVLQTREHPAALLRVTRLGALEPQTVFFDATAGEVYIRLGSVSHGAVVSLSGVEFRSLAE